MRGLRWAARVGRRVGLCVGLWAAAAGAWAQDSAPVTAFGLAAGDPMPATADCRADQGECRILQGNDWGQVFNRIDVQGNPLTGVCSLRAEHEIPVSRPLDVARFTQRLIERWRKQFGEPLWGQDDVTDRLLTDAERMTPGSRAYEGRGSANQLFHALWRLDAGEVARSGIRLVDARGYIGPAAERGGAGSARGGQPVFDTARLSVTVHFAQSAECVTDCAPVGQRVLPAVVGGVMRWRCLSQRGAALVPGFNWAWQPGGAGSLDYVVMVGPDTPSGTAAQRAALHFVRIDASDYAEKQFEAGLGSQGRDLKRQAGNLTIARRVVVSGRTSLGDRLRIYIALAQQPDEQGRHGYALVFKCFSGPCSEGEPPPVPFVLTHLPRERLTPLFNQMEPQERRRRIATMVD